MKHSLRLTGLLLATIFSITSMMYACSPPPAECSADKACPSGQTCSSEGKCVSDNKEQGDTEKSEEKKGEDKKQDEPTKDDTADGGTEPTPDTEPKKDGGVCPLGCPDCDGGTTPTNEPLTLGTSCTEPYKGAECTAQQACDSGSTCLKPNAYATKTYCFVECTADTDCKAASDKAGKTLTCQTVSGKKVCAEKESCDSTKNHRCIQNGINDVGYCYRSCNTDTDCDQGQKCQDDKFCATRVAELEACNYSRQAFCDAGLICLVSNSEQTAGICYKQCQQEQQCDATKDLTCRAFNASDPTNKLCMPKIYDGPLCIGQTCNTSATATNCQKGLVCDGGTCVKTCSSAADCDTASGEECKIVDITKPKVCLLPPSVTKSGEKCNNFDKRCDDTKGLSCASITEGNSICLKTCDPNKTNQATGINPDCDAGDICRATQNGSAFCLKGSDKNGSCVVPNTCKSSNDVCVGFSSDGTESYCLGPCDPKKNKSEDDESNPDCADAQGNLGRCVTLTNGSGACIPYRPKTKKAGENCGTDGNLVAPDCEDGLRCVNLGSGPTCYVDCDPCTAKLDSTGEWKHPKCNGGKDACSALTYSDGRAAGGVCRTSGDPVLDDGEYCDEPGKGCKEGLTCVNFSNEEGARPICSGECIPGEQGQCNGGSCASLTSGGGVCLPQAKRKVDLGGECLGTRGTDGFHDCLEKSKDGKPLVCALPAFAGAKRTCQILCNPVDGIQNNTGCKAQGLNNHLCLSADERDPKKGAGKYALFGFEINYRA